MDESIVIEGAGAETVGVVETEEDYTEFDQICDRWKQLCHELRTQVNQHFQIAERDVEDTKTDLHRQQHYVHINNLRHQLNIDLNVVELELDALCLAQDLHALRQRFAEVSSQLNNAYSEDNMRLSAAEHEQAAEDRPQEELRDRGAVIGKELNVGAEEYNRVAASVRGQMHEMGIEVPSSQSVVPRNADEALSMLADLPRFKLSRENREAVSHMRTLLSVAHAARLYKSAAIAKNVQQQLAIVRQVIADQGDRQLPLLVPPLSSFELCVQIYRSLFAEASNVNNLLLRNYEELEDYQAAQCCRGQMERFDHLRESLEVEVQPVLQNGDLLKLRKFASNAVEQLASQNTLCNDTRRLQNPALILRIRDLNKRIANARITLRNQLNIAEAGVRGQENEQDRVQPRVQPRVNPIDWQNRQQQVRDRVRHHELIGRERRNYADTPYASSAQIRVPSRVREIGPEEREAWLNMNQRRRDNLQRFEAVGRERRWVQDATQHDTVSKAHSARERSPAEMQAWQDLQSRRQENIRLHEELGRDRRQQFEDAQQQQQPPAVFRPQRQMTPEEQQRWIEINERRQENIRLREELGRERRRQFDEPVGSVVPTALRSPRQMSAGEQAAWHNINQRRRENLRRFEAVGRERRRAQLEGSEQRNAAVAHSVRERTAEEHRAWQDLQHRRQEKIRLHEEFGRERRQQIDDGQQVPPPNVYRPPRELSPEEHQRWIDINQRRRENIRLREELGRERRRQFDETEEAAELPVRHSPRQLNDEEQAAWQALNQRRRQDLRTIGEIGRQRRLVFDEQEDLLHTDAVEQNMRELTPEERQVKRIFNERRAENIRLHEQLGRERRQATEQRLAQEAAEQPAVRPTLSHSTREMSPEELRRWHARQGRLREDLRQREQRGQQRREQMEAVVGVEHRVPRMVASMREPTAAQRQLQVDRRQRVAENLRLTEEIGRDRRARVDARLADKAAGRESRAPAVAASLREPTAAQRQKQRERRQRVAENLRLTEELGRDRRAHVDARLADGAADIERRTAKLDAASMREPSAAERQQQQDRRERVAENLRLSEERGRDRRAQVTARMEERGDFGADARGVARLPDQQLLRVPGAAANQNVQRLQHQRVIHRERIVERTVEMIE